MLVQRLLVSQEAAFDRSIYLEKTSFNGNSADIFTQNVLISALSTKKVVGRNFKISHTKLVRLGNNAIT